MKVGVITTSRADFGIYLPLLKELESSKDFELILYAGGSHLEKDLGLTIEEVRSYKFKNLIELEASLGSGYDPADVSVNMGNSTIAMAKTFKNNPADFVICLGDRYEMIAAVLALVPFNVPIGHIHGGEETLGAIDNKFRHALTAMADYHFVSCETYRDRVIRMGNNPDRVLDVGALSLDKLEDFKPCSRQEIEKKTGLPADGDFSVITFHPTTVDSKERNLADLKEFIDAVKEIDHRFLITLPNADTYGDSYRKAMLELAAENKGKFFPEESLGAELFFSVMAHASVMLGNSSSGIIEAAGFNLPVLDVGERQRGRERSPNTIHTNCKKKDILEGFNKCLAMKGKSYANIYKSSGNTTKQITTFLKKGGLTAKGGFYV